MVFHKVIYDPNTRNAPVPLLGLCIFVHVVELNTSYSKPKLEKIFDQEHCRQRIENFS